MRDIWTLFEPEKEKDRAKENKENKEINKRFIKDRIIRDVRTLFEQEEDYYISKRVSNFGYNNYIEYESNGAKNRMLSLDENLKRN